MGQAGIDLKGINVANMGRAKEAVTNYVDEAKKVLDKLQTAPEEIRASEAIKGGEQIKGFEGYIQKVGTELNQLISNLEKFNEALDQIQKNYDTQQKELGDTLGAKTVTDRQVVGFHTGVNGGE